MKKVSDIVSDFIESKNINSVFLLTGGGIMHLTDSIKTNKKINFFCNYHEQASAISAEGYARITGKPGICISTIGPGIANALSGAIGAWHDSIPIILICGQVRKGLNADFSKIRQFGPQEANIIEMAKSITKYSVTIDNPDNILYELEKAYVKSISDRPGPVLIEIPLDIQASYVEENSIKNYIQEVNSNNLISDKKKLVINCINEIRKSKFPIIFPGNGIRLGNAFDLWSEFHQILKIPCVLPYTGRDLLPENLNYNLGIIGTLGQRRANFAVQNSDCFLSLASGINITKIGFNVSGFAPKAKKIILDIDHGQVYNQAVNPDLGIVMDIKEFLQIAIEELKKNPIVINKKWIDTCEFWKMKYPVISKKFYDDKEHVNMYIFHKSLSDLLDENYFIVTGNGMEAQSLFQTFETKNEQRILIPGNWGAMGWDLPTAVGAAVVAKEKNKKVVLLTGDGSIMLNIQELMTIKCNNLPVKIFIFNNKGYGLIRSTQKNLLNDNLIGSDFESGILNPDYKSLAKAFGFAYELVNNNDEILEKLPNILNCNAQIICELNIAYNVTIEPKSIAFKNDKGVLESKPLEDMYPFLPKEEVEMNMNLLNKN
jgi:acetolactate synthase-1/2/3 large subunit